MGLCFIYNIVFILLFDKIYPENTQIECIGEIISLKEEKENRAKYEVKILKNDDLKKSKNTKLIIYTDRNKDFFPGDVILIKGEFQKADKARNYKGFNYRNYLKQRKIHGIIFCEGIEKIGKKNDIYYYVGLIKKSLIIKSNNLYGKDYKEFINGILLGETNLIDEDIKEMFNNLEIAHILAISGLHINYIVNMIDYIIQKIIVDKKKKNCIIMIFLIAFYFFTGCKISCLRTIINYIYFLLGINIYRKSNFIISIFLSFIIIIALNPFNITNIGLWMSFLGTIGITVVYNFIYKIVKHKIIKTNLKSKLFIINFLKILLQSVSIQIMIFPISLYNFSKISLLFLISNFIVFLVIDKILILGYLSVIISYINLNLGKIFSSINKIFIYVLFKSTEILNSVPFSSYYIKTPSFLFLIIYYSIFLLLIFFITKRKFYFLRMVCSINFFKKNLVFYKKYLITIIIIILSTQILQINTELKIHFIDVGQGDCCVIEIPFGKSIVIDGGDRENYDYGKNVVLPYILDRGISNIDFLIISHFDNDHCGGAFYILKNMKVKNVIIGRQFETSDNYEEFTKLVKEKNIKVYVVQAGQKIKINKNLYLDIIWPDGNNAISENSINNNSLVFRLLYKDFSMLFTGDIEEKTEKEIAKENLELLNSTVLKVAHHGSKTSSSKEFLELVKPKIALIGVGKNNKFGHPSIITLENLQNIGCKIYRTDENGEISIITNGKNLKIEKYIK